MKENKHRLSASKRLLLAALFTLLILPIQSFSQGNFYYLIAGSFNNFERASEMVISLKSKGYSPQILFPTENSAKYRVSVYHSLNKQEVATYSSNLKKSDRGARSFWVYELSNEGTTRSVAGTKVKKRDLRQSKKKAKKDLGVDPNSETYHLVRGSMKSFEAAQEVVETLETKGYEPYLIFPKTTGGSYRIAVFASNDRKEVEAYANLLKKRNEPGGWILREDPGLKSTLNTPTNINARLASNSGATYHLIGGSFKRFEQASAYADAAKADGYDPLIMFPEEGKFNSFRVSIYRSTNKTEVASYNNSVKNQGKKGGWIYEQK